MNKPLRSAIAALSLSAAGFAGLSGYEGWSETATRPVPGDKCTYGIGSTTDADGKPVRCGDRITPPKAIMLAVRDISIKERTLKRCITAPMYQYEYDAFTSLAYNVGAEAVCASSIPTKINRGDYAAACLTILDFDGMRDCSKPKVFNARKQAYECPMIKIRGLTLRRQQEYRQCLGEGL